MARTAERLRVADVRVALLDLTALGREGNPESWYYGLLELIGQELRCLRPLRAFWEANANLRSRSGLCGPSNRSRWKKNQRRLSSP